MVYTYHIHAEPTDSTYEQWSTEVEAELNTRKHSLGDTTDTIDFALYLRHFSPRRAANCILRNIERTRTV